MTYYRPHKYVVGGRYGYSAVDEYDAENRCLSTIIAGVTKKEAGIISRACSGAAYQVLKDLGFKWDDTLQAYIKD